MKISIIVAVYNIESYLRRCLDSVVAQTYRDLEIILVDGSTDKSSAICDEYAEKDNRIKVLHGKDNGLSDARNAGLLIATGDFIGFIDGDDFIEPEMYELMLGAMIEHKADIAVCRYRQISEVSDIENPATSNEICTFDRSEALDIYISEDKKYRIVGSVWSKLFTREVINGLEFAVGKTAEDIMYTTMALCQARRVVYVDKYLYNYIVDRKDSIMNQKIGERRINNDVGIWKEQIEFLKSKGFYELSNKAVYYFYRRLLFYFIEFKLWKQSDYSEKLAKIVRADKDLIKKIYREPWVKTGDKVRMKTFLFWPQLYYLLVRLDEKTLIPIRARFRK